MKKALLVILGIAILCFPLVVIGVVYLSLSKNIFDNPDFWYGYMAYFGTTFLAIVSLWQNENANRINRNLSEKNLYYQKVASQKLFPIIHVENISSKKCEGVPSFGLEYHCPSKCNVFDRYSMCRNSTDWEEILAINLDIDDPCNLSDDSDKIYKKSIHLCFCNSSEAVIRHILIDDIVINGYKDKVPTKHCKNITPGDGFAYFLGPNESFPLTVDIYFKNDLVQKLYDFIAGGIEMTLYLTNTTITGIQQKQHVVIRIAGNNYVKVSYGDRIYTEETNNGQAENADAEQG